MIGGETGRLKARAGFFVRSVKKRPVFLKKLNAHPKNKNIVF